MDLFSFRNLISESSPTPRPSPSYEGVFLWSIKSSLDYGDGPGRRGTGPQGQRSGPDGKFFRKLDHLQYFAFNKIERKPN